jgi:predicted DCC family thiol-disulfide oxidoreductase YuxK
VTGPSTGLIAILYDDECGFCRWSADKILAWDSHRRLRPVALQEPEADRLLKDMDRRRRMASWHLVMPDGEILSAGAAVPELMRHLPGGAPLAIIAQLAPGPTEAAYRFVSNHRDRLASILGPKRRGVDPKRRRGGEARHPG